jgi:hypothetical protein
MEAIGIGPVFVDPVRSGVWTTGVASLPPSERGRYLRHNPWSRREGAPAAWRPEFLDLAAWRRTLDDFIGLGLITPEEAAEALAVPTARFPFFAASRQADSLHLHVKVESVDTLPHERIIALGTRPENAKPGYVKYSFPGGLNLIFSDIPIAEEDSLDYDRGPRPFLDHMGVDLRREIGVVHAAYSDTPAIARRQGWAHKAQGGPGRPVYCCHATVAEKHWVYPPAEGSNWLHPVEFAYGPLEIGEEMNGCDLRPIDPRHPLAAEYIACHPESTTP